MATKIKTTAEDYALLADMSVDVPAFADVEIHIDGTYKVLINGVTAYIRSGTAEGAAAAEAVFVDEVA